MAHQRKAKQVFGRDMTHAAPPYDTILVGIRRPEDGFLSVKGAGTANFFRQREPQFHTWAKPAAVMVLIADVDQSPSVLLIRRPSALAEHAGQVACPGGRYDSTLDRSLWDTARRETVEEVGIAVTARERLGFLDPVFIPVTGYTILPAVARLRGVPTVVPAVAEVADWAWISLAELRRVRRMALVDSVRGRFWMPEFPTGWARVWGATARILDQLLHRPEGAWA
ncbi:MAG: CoA pyrophosphatase [Sulfobacillus sp.]|nr:CoA pyrophosphatase [Sulfobacillus sp.]